MKLKLGSLLDASYQRSPIWVQQIGVAAYGWWWYHRRFGHAFRALVEEFKERDRWTEAQFAEYQETLLRRLFAAAQNSPYYSCALKGWETNGLTARETLSRLPFLSKQTLRERPDDLLSEDPLPRDVLSFKSSGTTGTPSKIYYTRWFHNFELAVPVARGYHWAGLTGAERRVMFGVRKVCRFDQRQPPFWRYSPVEDMAYASVYHLSPSNIPAYLAFMRRFRPAVIMGYPSALNVIARFALEHGDMPAPAKSVMTTSETVTDSVREAIETAWQCRLSDRYGAVEGCLLASQCEFGRYHVSPDVGVVEILDEAGRPCEPGQLGEVVCTGLHNTLQPLIRYRLGDVARWAIDQSCPCGRSMPILEAIEGRLEDVCYTQEGRQIVRFDTVFKGVEHIREAQVVQEASDRFAILVVPDGGFGAPDADLLRKNMRLHVGDIGIDVRPVDTIERTASGKFRAVVCKLTNDEKSRLARASAPCEQLQQ
jgi:phenylacetate-CoA ligase